MSSYSVDSRASLNKLDTTLLSPRGTGPGTGPLNHWLDFFSLIDERVTWRATCAIRGVRGGTGIRQKGATRPHRSWSEAGEWASVHSG